MELLVLIKQQRSYIKSLETIVDAKLKRLRTVEKKEKVKMIQTDFNKVIYDSISLVKQMEANNELDKEYLDRLALKSSDALETTIRKVNAVSDEVTGIDDILNKTSNYFNSDKFKNNLDTTKNFFEDKTKEVTNYLKSEEFKKQQKETNDKVKEGIDSIKKLFK